MKCCCKTWCVGASAAVLGLATAGGWALLRNKPAPAIPDIQPAAVAHASPKQVLAGTLERLHREALAHFHADPANGYKRMPPVYEKVAKEWKTPWFSPGDLDNEEPIPFAKDMKHIHDGSMKDFLSTKPPVANDSQQPPTVIWQNGKFDKGQKVWEAKSIDLIGLLKSPEPMVYVSEKIQDADGQDQPPTRMLDPFEQAGLQALTKGENLFGRSRDGVIRLLGAVRAEASCVKCHRDKKEGDLLGAFSYVVREAEYAQVPFGGKRAAPIPKKAAELAP
jgi:hypothetical protein